MTNEQIEDIVHKIETEIESDFLKEIETREIGERLMKCLRKLDEVAYVRFASVYRKFEDKEEFMEALKHLKGQKKKKR